MTNVSLRSGVQIFLKKARFDATVWITSLAAAVLLVLYNSPILPPGKLEYFAELGVPMAIGIALFSMLHGLRRVEHTEERYFWLAVAVALGCWLGGRVFYFFQVSTPRPEYLYLAYYIAMFIALDQRPHLKSGWALGTPRSVFATAGSLILTAGFLSYFILVPSIWAAQASEIVNQHYVYLLMDTLVGVRFYLLHRSCRSQRWKYLYALLALSAALVIAEDLRDYLHYSGLAPQAAGGWLDVLYYLPHATLIVATRLRNFTAETRRNRLEDWPKETHYKWALPGLLWAFALALPTIHLTLSILEMLDVTYREQLDLTVLFFSLVLTALALTQMRFSEKERSLMVSQLAIRRRTDRELRENKLSALRRLCGSIAHRFNNLLQIIVGYGQMLLGKPETDWQQRLQIGKMLEATAEAADLTDQLLAFSKSTVLRPRPLEINALLEDRHHRLQRTVGSDLVIGKAFDVADLWIVADSEAVSHALKTIVTFASARMPQGSEISLATRSIQLDGQSEFGGSLLEPGQYAEISLRCGGWNLAEADLQKVLEPFGLDGSDGLALATARAIIEESDGHLGAAIEPGRAVNFRILFALCDPPTEPGDPAVKPVTEATLRCVLLVEDNNELRDMLTDYLRHFGLDVLATRDGENALEICHRHHAVIDLLLTDVVMPRMGGFDLAKEVAEHYPEIEILFMSGHLAEGSQPDTVRDWKARYLAKPFALRDLRKKLLELFPSWQDSRQEKREDD